MIGIYLRMYLFDVSPNFVIIKFVDKIHRSYHTTSKHNYKNRFRIWRARFFIAIKITFWGVLKWFNSQSSDCNQPNSSLQYLKNLLMSDCITPEMLSLFDLNHICYGRLSYLDWKNYGSHIPRYLRFIPMVIYDHK